MLYINQLDYENMPYHHNMKNGGAGEGRNNVKTGGCGLCCLCMIVSNLAGKVLELETCRDMSEALHANMDPGTNLEILAPEVAKLYGLEYSCTDEVDVLKEHMKKGGMAIAQSGGDREGYIGVFTHGGHFLVLDHVEEDQAYLLDPSYQEGKFDEPSRVGKVHLSLPFVVCDMETLRKDCENRTPAYYLFSKEGDKIS